MDRQDGKVLKFVGGVCAFAALTMLLPVSNAARELLMAPAMVMLTYRFLLRVKA